MGIFTEQEKNKLIELNSGRINQAKRLPYQERQEAFDKIVQDINTVSMIKESYMIDMALIGAKYALSTDIQLN